MPRAVLDDPGVHTQTDVALKRPPAVRVLFSLRRDIVTPAAFEPTDAALAARLQAVDPAAYARTRNVLDGRVTRLSPYLTHGFTDVPAIVRALRARAPLPERHKLVFELAWREYFHHLWRHWGEGIFDNRRPPPGRGYTRELPADLRRGATGVPVVDRSVRELYRTGYLHNHARMWLASYAVHLRKVHWRTGADWMYRHLLDGDLASNHLSWQWVAGTLTGRAYLFDAANVARYAPAWASPGTVIDNSYEALEEIARTGRDVGPEPGDEHAAIDEPVLAAEPPDECGIPAVRSTEAMLIHPWALARVDGPVIGMVATDFHARFPWSRLRWRFVMQRMRELCGDAIVVGSSSALVEALGKRSLRAVESLNPVYRDLLVRLDVRTVPAPRYFVEPGHPCRSFSQFWERVQKPDLLG